jgi:hypothetical protein
MAAASIPTDDAQAPNVLPWILVLLAAIAAVGGILVSKKKKAAV